MSSRYPDDDEWASIEPSFTTDYDALTRRRTERRPPGKSRARRRRIGFFLLATIAFVMGLGTGYARGYFAPGEEGAIVTVTIPEGATLTAIGQELEAKGVVKHARAFIIQAQSDGHSTKFKPGTYRFHQNEPYESLVAGLMKGVKPPTVKLTIPEGSTLQQTAVIASDEVATIGRDAYVRVGRDDPPRFELQGYKAGTTLEGMLFPATYELDPKTKAGAFVDDQLEAFDSNFGEVDMTRAHKANLTEYDVVIIASMVEREARVAQERPMVAAVIWNRLKKGMLLQIDATIQYALGETNRCSPTTTSRSTLPTTPTRTPVCRRRRSPIPAWRRCRPPPTQPTSTTSTTSRATTAPAATTSPTATTSSWWTRRRRRPAGQ